MPPRERSEISGDVAGLKLSPDDGIELAELLDFLRHLLGHDPSTMADALASFCGAGYGVGELGADLARLAFLLDGDPERFKSHGE